MVLKELGGLNIPRHIAIILDGNRRYAKKYKLNPLKGHDAGAKTFEKLLGWLEEIEEIKNLTAYTFSIKNFHRPPEEVNHLMKLFKTWFTRFSKDKRIIKNKG